MNEKQLTVIEKQLKDELEEMDQQMDVLGQMLGVENLDLDQDDSETEKDMFTVSQVRRCPPRRRTLGPTPEIRKLNRILRRLRNHTRRLRNIQDQLGAS